MNNKYKKIAIASIKYTILIVVGMFMLYPLLWLVGASFKTNNEIFSSISFFPEKLDFSGYTEGWKMGSEYTFTTYYINTMKIVIPRVILGTISSVLTAYGFARFQFQGKKFLFALLIGTLLLPEVVLRIPTFLIFKELGWLDSYLPLIVPSALATQTFFVFLLIQFIRTIPKDLEEAAYIDGCSHIQALFFIVIPVIMPGIITVTLFGFLWAINDFMGPLLYVSSVEKFPISLALKISIDAQTEVVWNRIIAMSLVSIIPSLLIFFCAAKSFMGGITEGSLKG